MPPQIPDRAPAESSNSHHDHHGHLGGHVEIRQPVTQNHDQDEQRHTRREYRQTTATT